MSGDPRLSDRIRGIGPRTTSRRVAFSIGDVALCVLGALGLSFVVSGEVDAGFGSWFFGLLVLIGTGGLVMVGHQAWFVRHRSGVQLGPAPSGAPATVVPRSGFGVLMSLVGTSALMVYFAAATVVLALAGSGWLVVTGAFAALLVWPLVPAAAGRIRPGGLYLTTAGIEHRRDAVLWSLPWAAVAGSAPGEPVAIVLEGLPGVSTSTTTPVVWNREVEAPTGVVGVDCRLLGLDGVQVAAANNLAIAYPDRRAELGTEASLRWAMFPAS